MQGYYYYWEHHLIVTPHTISNWHKSLISTYLLKGDAASTWGVEREGSLGYEKIGISPVSVKEHFN